MEAVNKTNGNIYRIQQDTNGKWFGYCDRTKEYTPAFVKLKGLIGLLELKGYEVVAPDFTENDSLIPYTKAEEMMNAVRKEHKHEKNH